MMAKIDIANEITSNHSDAEIIEFLSSVMAGVVRNYKVALEKNDTAAIWANLGDIAMVSKVLNRLDKKNQERLAVQENM